MAKGKKTVYFCQNCGHEETKWLGQCPACKEWNTFVEEKVIASSVTSGIKTDREIQIVSLSEVNADDQDRITTGMAELDRVLGGGIVPGSLVLVGGDPGIGKSTLLFRESFGAIYFRGRIAFPDQTPCKPDGDVSGKFKTFV